MESHWKFDNEYGKNDFSNLISSIEAPSAKVSNVHVSCLQ